MKLLVYRKNKKIGIHFITSKGVLNSIFCHDGYPIDEMTEKDIMKKIAESGFILTQHNEHRYRRYEIDCSSHLACDEYCDENKIGWFITDLAKKYLK